MKVRLGRILWAGGWPARTLLVALIRVYRLTLGGVIGGSCRFYPSCSEYAELAIGQVGAVRGSALAVWRVLRCSPLTKGGVDYPPSRRRLAYDGDIPCQPATVARARGAEPAAEAGR